VPPPMIRSVRGAAGFIEITSNESFCAGDVWDSRGIAANAVAATNNVSLQAFLIFSHNLISRSGYHEIKSQVCDFMFTFHAK